MKHQSSGHISCKDAAVRLLARRDYSESELCTKLETKGYTEREISETCRWCKQAGYLDDLRYAELLVRQYLKKGYGELKIRYTMKQKVSETIIQAVLDEDDIDWYEQARQTAEKKYASSTVSGEQKEYARRVRFLQSRGFNFEQIQYALKNICSHMGTKG
ncbi:Regulatory protein RecX [Vibrio aerogenes CECT 7868]|uniref:Regulatory protein RecX n=1 Tax=Vibrio aerogenes CECT 7868 TaxID=1216006 RepID=A0A1M5YEC9_9VIBR|nr:regulatory protein RecX [Vibrio aerogenes]SHI10302.1 Regulatory protein RecX [Vibrio aerogenes CECT 7868]